jgi:hypothetical protein
VFQQANRYMSSVDAKREWRSYAAWGSLLCGSVGLVLTVAVAIYIDFGQERPFDVWEARYFITAAPVSFLGVILGAIGKDTPRMAGLVLSTLVLLRVLGGAFAV